MRRNAFLLALTLGLSFATHEATASTGTRTSAFEYDPTTGLLTKEIIEGEDSNLCLVTAYTYDGYGNRLSATTRNCNGSTANEAVSPTGAAVFTSRTIYTAYQSGAGYPAGMFPTSNTDALTHQELKTFDARFGSVSTNKDPNLVQRSLTYDDFGRPSLGTNGDGTKLQLTYSFCSGVNGGTATCPSLATYVVKSQPLASDGVTSNGTWTEVFYDALNRQISSQTLGFDGTSVIVVATTYDALGHVASKSRPYYSTGTAQLTNFNYDNIDRATLQTNPDTSTRGTTYNGLTVTATNELAQTKVRTSNSQGQLLTVTDAASQTISYLYDPFGGLAQTTDPVGNVIASSHDIRGRKVRSIDPDMGTWTYIYDALGQLTSQTNANNQTSTMSYDISGRVIARTEPDLNSTWTYDTCTNGIGKLCSASSNDGYSRVVAYDTLSRPLSATTTADTTYTNSVSYDTNGRVATQSFPGGVTVNFTYTSLSYLQKIVDASSGTIYWQANAADAEGHITTQIYGNGIVTNNAFDPKTGWLQTTQAGSGNTIVNLAYLLDSLGNVKTRQDINQSMTETFTYDNLNRLKTSSVAGKTALSYSYDALGNMSTRSDVGTYTYGSVNSRPHAVASISGTVNTSYGYDNDGNMTSGNGRTVTYTSFDMPNTISSSGANDTFVYGPEHQRVKRQTTTATTIYVNPDSSGGLAYEKDMTSGGVTTEERVYVSAGGDPVVMLKKANGTGSFVPYYLHRDNIGSTVAITNSSGTTILEHLAYEPFGKRRAPDGTSDPTNAIKGVNSDRGFTDHEHLDDLALVHMNGRLFDPLVGRFLSADSHVQFADDLQSYNRYSYVSNNPLNTRDPTGYFSLGSLFGDSLKDVNGFYHFLTNSSPASRSTGQYLGTHQWAYILAEIVAAEATAVACGGCGSAALSADVTYARTRSFKAALKAGAITYVEGEAIQGINSNFSPFNSDGVFQPEDAALNAAGKAAIACAGAAASGGKCGPAAASAAFSAVSYSDNVVVQAVVGGTGSVLGGGTFANGAETGAFGYLLTPNDPGLSGLSLSAIGRGFEILGVDLYAEVIGNLGSIYVLGTDIAAGKAPWSTLGDLSLPHYANFGGKAWGVDQSWHDRSDILNSADVASYNHDLSCAFTCANQQWVRDSWQGNPNYLPPGPFGVIYRLLGTVPFWLTPPH